MEPADQNEINFETMLSAEPWDYMTDSDKRNAIDCASAEIARLRAELEQARENKGNDAVMLLDITSKYIKAIEERDEAVKRRDFAVSGEENLRYLKQLWEQECGYYRAKWWEAVQANDRSRRTIAALVVAARAMNSAARARLGWRRALTWTHVCRKFVVGRKPRKAKQAGEQA